MTLKDKADKYNMYESELKDFLLSDTKNVRFFKNHPLTGELDPVADRGIDEIMQKAGALPSSKGSAFMNEPESDTAESDSSKSDAKSEDSESVSEKIESDDDEKKDEDTIILGTPRAGMSMSLSQSEQELESESNESKSKSGQTRSRKKKPSPSVEVESEIDVVPNTVLRKFYAENFSVKPEKIFFMDDASVKEKVNEKYIVMERDEDYLFMKRTVSVISVKKD